MYGRRYLTGPEPHASAVRERTSLYHTLRGLLNEFRPVNWSYSPLASSCYLRAQCKIEGSAVPRQVSKMIGFDIFEQEVEVHR